MKKMLAALLVLALAALSAAADPEPAPENAQAAEPKAGEPAARQPKSEIDLLIERVDQAREKITRLESNAVHERVVEVMDLEEKFKGSFLFEKPHLLRMELKETIERGRERIYIVGKETAWIIHPARKQAEKAPISTEGLGAETQRQQNPFTYGLTHGIGELRKTFNMRIIGEAKIGEYETTVLELTPIPEVVEKEGRTYPKTVFWIDNKTSLPVQVRQFKSRGQILETFTLSDIEINPRVFIRLSNPFNYTPPRDYQVIEYNGEGL